MNQNLKKRGLIGFVALAALTCALPVHAQDDDEIKKNNLPNNYSKSFLRV